MKLKTGALVLALLASSGLTVQANMGQTAVSTFRQLFHLGGEASDDAVKIFREELNPQSIPVFASRAGARAIDELRYAKRSGDKLYSMDLHVVGASNKANRIINGKTVPKGTVIMELKISNLAEKLNDFSKVAEFLEVLGKKNLEHFQHVNRDMAEQIHKAIPNRKLTQVHYTTTEGNQLRVSSAHLQLDITNMTNSNLEQMLALVDEVMELGQRSLSDF